MAACPWCQVRTESGFFMNSQYCVCTSTANPKVKKKGDCTNTGVAWGRCVKGEKVGGIDFKQCPFYKTGTRTRSKSKK